MIRLCFCWLILFLSTHTALAQRAGSQEAFFAHITKGQSSYLQVDTVLTTSEKDSVPYTIYLEARPIQEDWFFLVYHQRAERAGQFLCQCKLDSLQLYFQKIERALRERRLYEAAFLPNNVLSNSFYDNHCLGTFGLTPFLRTPPVIEPLLNGDLSPPHHTNYTLHLDLEAQMVLREDGQWILDLEGRVPDSLLFIEVGESQLHYLRSETDYYYPGPQIPAWKANLVRNGHYTDQLLGYPEPVWDTDLGNTREFAIANAPQAWNLQYMLAAGPTPSTDLEAAGSINLVVNDGSASTTIQPFDFFEGNERYKLEHHADGLLYFEKIAEEKGFYDRFSYGTSALWQQIVIFEEGGDTLAYFNAQDAPKERVVQTQAGRTYLLQLTTLDKQTVSVHFRQSLSRDPLLKPVPVPNFQRTMYRLENTTFEDGTAPITAAYRFYAAPGSIADSLELTKAYDDTGKDLLQGQVAKIAEYNAWIDALGENRNNWDTPIEDYWKKGFVSDYVRYPENPKALKCRIELWNRPSLTASSIYLAGKYHYQLPDSTWVTKSWRDRLQLGTIESPALPPGKPLMNPATTLLPFSWVQLKTPGIGVPPKFEAGIELMAPMNHWCTGIELAQSKLLEVYDNLGHNLLDTASSAKPANKKALIYPYLLDKDQALTPIQSGHGSGYGTPMKVASFSIQTPNAPTIDATQVVGKVQVTYKCFDEQEMLYEEVNIYYNDQERIDLELNGHIITYKRANDTRMVDGKVYRSYDLQHENLPVFIGGIVAKDGEEFLSPDPIIDYYPYYQLYIPVDLEERYLDILIYYAELYSRQATVNFEVSIGGTIGE